MRALSGQELVRIWEVGQGQHPLDRALTVLGSAFPEAARDELALLSVGQRDACLFAVRERLFGSRLVSLAACPACQEKLEFVLDIADMQIVPNIQPGDAVRSMPIEGGELHFRLPNSFDLAAIVVGSADISAARHMLLRRCIVHVVRDGVEVTSEEPAETVAAELAAQMEVCDPLAEIQVDLDCLVCGHRWQLLFDIIAFLWAEITAEAKRLLREVHTLARFYGWREADILSMSTVRRQFYLGMVS